MRRPPRSARLIAGAWLLTRCRSDKNQHDQVRGVDRPPAGLGRPDEPEGHGQSGCPRARSFGHLVRRRTVAKVDSMGLVFLRCTHCSAGKARRPAAPRGPFRPSRWPWATWPVSSTLEPFGVGPVLASRTSQSAPGGGLGRLGQGVHDVGHLMDPAALVHRLGEDFAERPPEPEGPSPTARTGARMPRRLSPRGASAPTRSTRGARR